MNEQDLIPPGNPFFAKLAHHHKRTMNLSDIPIVIDGNVKLCAWCGTKPITPPRRKYCSEECSDSTYLYFNPSSNNCLAMIMKRQECKCNICGHDYKPHLEMVHLDSLLREEESYKSWLTYSNEMKAKYPYHKYYDHELEEFCNFRSVSYLRFFDYEACHFKHEKRLHIDIKDLGIEVDHIIPIAAGGEPFGLCNVQAICHKCHSIKTKSDMVEIRKFQKQILQ